jgi:RHS repeat-associated protein
MSMNGQMPAGPVPVQLGSPRRPGLAAWLRRAVGGLMSVVLVLTLADLPSQAAVQPDWEPPAAPQTEGVAVSPVPPAGLPGFAAADAVVTAGRTVTWPQPATATVDLPPDSAGLAGRPDQRGAPEPGRAGRAPAGDLPVRVGAAPLPAPAGGSRWQALEQATARMPQRVGVSAVSRAVTRSMGVDGLLLSLARADGQPVDSSVAVEVDYSGFRYAFGADWASRLQVTLLGGCAGHPAGGQHGAGGRCGTVTPLPTANDYQSGLLAAEVPLAGDGGSTMMAITGGPSGDNGDFTGTSLSPAGTWQVSAQTGGFSWSYPLRMVPGVGGPEPSLALSYSSQAVDGLTANTNTQGSWIGDGWDLWPGYIERRYQGCAEDMDPVGGQQPNNPTETGDLCWVSGNATMSLNGRAVELVDDGGGRYRPVGDDGSRIERLTNTGLGNGDNNGEYWKVTTVDGMQYFFGRHRRPAYPTDTAATNSTWTAPVYGNHPGEPCYQSGDFSGSRCTQAWRWNLDYVIDPHGNSMTLFYARENGAYARELDPDLRTVYHRGGYLKRIEYGTRSGQEHTAPAPARVMFDEADRCLPSSSCDPADSQDWPDTPWDQYCQAAPCTIDQLAPTFWTQKRLAKVRSQVWRGSGHADVESWTLRHDYLDAGAADGEGVPMWLSGITRTGHVTTAGGGVAADPEVTFDPGSTPLANRVDGPSDGKTWLNRWRLKDITTESGALVGVIYSGTECTLATVPDPHTNDMRCFPQWYSGGVGSPTLDWFHKYVVESVLVDDATGASPRMETHWDYLDDPAWHYDDSELVAEDKRTWAQWRGYSQVRVRQGSPAGTQSATDYLFMRGMHGDRASPSGGTKSVQITDSQSISITDHEAHTGFLRESVVYNGVGGGWVSGEINDPWRHGPTATAGPLKAWLTGTAATRERTALAGGGTRWTRTETSFDTTYGMPVEVDDLGDESTSLDDECVRYQYARNTSLWIVDRVADTEAVDVACSVTPQRPDDVLSHDRVFYDDPNSHGVAPTRGLAVKTQEVGSWSGSNPVWATTSRSTFDANGRITEMRDSLDRPTTTAYSPPTGGPVTSLTTTDPAGHAATVTVDAAWQLPVHAVDANGRVTDLSYDGLGRIIAGWGPGRDQATESPNVEFDYLVRNDAPSAVTTRVLLPLGTSYRTSITLLDGMLRERQVQTQATGGSRTIVDTMYDSRGLIDWATKEYDDETSSPPDTTLVGPSGQPEVPGIVESHYDGAGRLTDEVFLALGSEAWRTSHAYGGDRVHTTPPAGGTATTSITDARGQTVALRQYHGPAPTGTYDEVTYDYTARGELETVTDAAGNTWTYQYDQRGRRISASDPDAGTSTSSYDAAGQPTTSTDGRGLTLGYTYDVLGRRTSVRDGSPTGPKRAEWIYDTLPGGLGKVTRSIRYDNGEQYVDEVVGYDAAGRPTGNRVIIPAGETGLAGTYETTLTYLPNGALYTVRMPAAGDLPTELIGLAYNDVGMQTGITSGYSIYVYEATYNKLGELTRRVVGNFGKRVSVTYDYDESTGRLLNTSAVPENKPQAMDLAYSYDDAGNLVRIADSPGSAFANDTQCFEYDHVRRLVEAWTPASPFPNNCDAGPNVLQLGGVAPYWRSWSYDVTGNRVSETRHAAAGNTVSTYQYPVAGSPRPHAVTQVDTIGPGGSSVDTFTYDSAGNTTGRLMGGQPDSVDFDPEGRVVETDSSTGSSSYLYDADGGRLIRRDPGGKTLYLPGQEVHWDAATGTVSCIRYVSHLGTPIGVRTSSGLTWLVTDHHQTAELAVRASDMQVVRRRSFPFGEPRGADPVWWPDDKGFLGGTEDPSGLTHLGARLYNPDLGRFISVDPLLVLGDPQQMNGYAYANNNPVSFFDPTGLVCTPDGVSLCAGQDVRTQPAGKPKSRPKYYGRLNGPCVDYCGSRADNRVRREFGAPTIGQGGLTGPVEPGQRGRSLDDTAAARYKKPFGKLTPAEKENARYETFTFNNPTMASALLDARLVREGLNDEYGLGNELLGTADAHRCFAKGNASGCVWLAIGLTPAKVLKLGRLFSKLRWLPWASKACSFSGDTLILMADGTTKPISQVRPGERVVATDPRTGERTAETVQVVWRHRDSLVQLQLTTGATISGGVQTAAMATVTTTEDHPFWNHTDQQWQPALTLDRGDRLLAPTTLAGGDQPTVVGLLATTQHEGDAYNLTVTNTHTYYVMAGDTPVLVHNCGDEIDDVSRSIADHSNAVFNKPGGMDHYVRGVDPGGLGNYVDGVINGNVPNVETRFLRGGRVAYWDPDKGAVVIEEGSGGTVFTPREGKTYFDDLD